MKGCRGTPQIESTLNDFLAKIEEQYGKADLVWGMDRGIPTEEILAQMRASTPPMNYLVGTPKADLRRLSNLLLQEIGNRPGQVCV
jgi:hypothetical protein